MSRASITRGALYGVQAVAITFLPVFKQAADDGKWPTAIVLTYTGIAAMVALVNVLRAHIDGSNERSKSKTS